MGLLYEWIHPIQSVNFLPYECSATCINCSEPLSGHYCSNCGERVISHHDYTLSHFLELAVESLFHLDGRFFGTFRLLLDRPGALAEAFLQGRRKPYMGPVQCFLVANLVFFLIQPLTGFETFTTTLYLHLHERMWSGLANKMVTAHLAATGIPQEVFADKFDHAAHLQAHTLLIIMVPMFAAALMLFYGRARKFYAEHLVHAFYMFAFLLIWLAVSTLFAHVVVLILILLSIRINGDIYELTSSLFTMVPFAIYVFLADRSFYKQSIIRTAWKTACLTFSVVLIITLYRSCSFSPASTPPDRQNFTFLNALLRMQPLHSAHEISTDCTRPRIPGIPICFRRSTKSGRSSNTATSQSIDCRIGSAGGQRRPGCEATVTLRPVSGTVARTALGNDALPQAANSQRGGQQGGRGGPQAGGGPGGGGNPNQVATGDDGTFEFLNVTPGQYQIAVDHDGFISQEYGQRTWNGRGTPITLTAGQRVPALSIQLVPTGTIAGKIVDERGDPLPRVQVQALTYQYQNGVRTLVSGRQELTNDQGDYRLYWLTPGDYYISATPNTGGPGPGPGGRGGPPTPVASTAATTDEAYAATYYPGGTDPETAVTVRVPAAQEIRGMDFVLRPVHTVKVSGKITVPAIASSTTTQTPAQQNAQAQQNGRGGGRGGPGGPGGPGFGPGNGQVQVVFTRVGGSSAGGGRGGGGRGGGNGGPGGPGGGRGGPGGPGGQAQVFMNQDGTFEIQNVVPGSYNLTAFQPAQNQLLSARMRVEVGYGKVENVNLTLSPGVDIAGKVTVDDSKTPQQFQMNRLRVQLTPTEDLPVGNAQAQVLEDGTFVLTSVAAMSYRLTVNGISNGGYVIGGRYGNADAFGELVQVETDKNVPLTMQLGFSAGSVTGTVNDNRSQPFQAATCVLIPASRGRVDLYKTATSDQFGKFTFANVPPGDYKLFAWEDIPTGAYLDPTFLKQFEGQSQSITVNKGTPSSAQIKVIPAAP